MTNRKKSIILLNLLLFAFLFFSVEAAKAVEFTLTPDKETASPGEEVIFSVKISENEGILALTLDINLDENRLSYIGFEESEFKDWSVTAHKAAWVGKTSTNFNGEILKLKYVVKSDAYNGEAPVTINIKDGDVANAEARPVPAVVDPEPVEITGGRDEPGPQPPQPQPEHGGHGFPFFVLNRIANGILPGTGFSARSPLSLAAKPLDLNYKPIRKTLEIPSLSVNTEIVTVPFVDGEYPITWLGSSVGMLDGSALPGEGYTILTGHNHLNSMEAGPFVYLSSLNENDRIFIRDTHDNLQTYVVYVNEKISQSDLAAVERIAGMFDNSITMITCEDEMITGGYANRRIVAAKPYGK